MCCLYVVVGLQSNYITQASTYVFCHPYWFLFSDVLLTSVSWFLLDIRAYTLWANTSFGYRPKICLLTFLYCFKQTKCLNRLQCLETDLKAPVGQMTSEGALLICVTFHFNYWRMPDGNPEHCCVSTKALKVIPHKGIAGSAWQTRIRFCAPSQNKEWQRFFPQLF